MEVTEADCSSPDVMVECNKFINADVSFIPLPHEKRLQLAISSRLKLPINMTLQSGTCEINCEGGQRENCTTTTRHYYFENVISPIFFENCSSKYHYCVIAQIGDCCPVCTETKYMTEYEPGTFSAPVSSWESTIVAFVSLVIIVGFGAIIIYLYNFGRNASKSATARRAAYTPPVLDHQLELKAITEVTVLCLYVKEDSPSFMGDIGSLQLFLREKGFNVIDIYNEEDIIEESIHKWVQIRLRDCKTKIILIDTNSFRSLLENDMASYRARKIVEQSIIYIRECIPLLNMYTQLFVVRFQENALSEERFFDLSNGRSYLFPINGERLAEDLQC